ncbi:DUF2188 domain-containing protein [Tianweitania sediminis]|nr:DUF2188 domain-containing protein [Tianweitania sediminis]
MRKLLLLALGYAAYRWLSSPAEDRMPQTMDRGAQPRWSGGSGRSSGGRSPTRSDATPEEQGDAGKVTYRVVEHDGGWAYKVGDVFSETFGTHDDALKAANAAARAQQLAGEPEPIEYQDESGTWRQEDASGDDRPDTGVEDTEPRKG